MYRVEKGKDFGCLEEKTQQRFKGIVGRRFRLLNDIVNVLGELGLYIQKNPQDVYNGKEIPIYSREKDWVVGKIKVY